MNTIKIYLAESGRIADLKKDFPLYQGQFQNKLLNIFVPTSILAPDFSVQNDAGVVLANYVASTSVKIGMTYVARNGTIKVSKNYYMRYLKTLMYQGVEYALYERKLPKEFTLYAGQGTNAPVLIANVVNIEQDTENGEPKVLSVITSQTCSLDVMPSTNLDADESIEPSELERIEADINSINQVLLTKQNKIDYTLETQNKTVVGAINENKTNITVNTVDIQSNTEDIASLRNELDDIRASVSSGENYVGTLTVQNAPSQQDLSNFVQQTKGRQPAGGDVVIVVLHIEGATDKNFKYIYNGQTWSGYEIPPMELAGNGDAGLISGTYGTGSTNTTLVDISGGQILNVYVKAEDGTFRNIREYLNDTDETINDIILGVQVVGEAMKALEDGLGNNIVNTYLTQTLGASKQYVRDYAMPRVFNDVYFITSSGYQTSVPTTPASGIQFTTTTNAVGSFQIFSIEKNNTADFELSSKNGYSNNIYISSSVDTKITLRLTTQYQKGNGNWEDLNVELSNPLSLSAGDIEKVMFGNPFTSLEEEVISLTSGDKIRQILEVVTQSSTATTFNVYSNDIYPSIFNLTSQSYTMGAVEDAIGKVIMIGADGYIQGNNAVFAVQDVDSYIEFKTNQRKFLFTLYLPVVGTVSDDLVLRIEFGDHVYNVYSFINGANTPLTLGDFKALSRQDGTGYYYYMNLIFIVTSDIQGFVVDPAFGLGGGNGGGGSVSIDNETITENASNEIQAVALKNGVTIIDNNDNVLRGNFKGVVELKTIQQYNALKTNGSIVVNGETITYDENTIYTVPSGNLEGRVYVLEGKVSALETTITDITPDVMRALKTPMAMPTATEIVAVDSTNSQAMLTIGDGLIVENDTLKAVGGGGGGSVEVVDNLSSTSTTSALSANQGRLLNEQLSSVTSTADSNTEQIEFLQSDVAGKTNVTINNVHQDYVNFSSDPQTQLNNALKSTDFSKNTKTTFGNWDVQKRKKISTTTAQVSTVSSGSITQATMQLTEALSYGDVFEIEYGVGADFAVTKVARFVWKGGNENLHSFEVPVVVTSDNNIYTGSCYGYISASGLLTIQNWVLYKLVSGSAGYTNGFDFNIYNVYKVV